MRSAATNRSRFTAGDARRQRRPRCPYFAINPIVGGVDAVGSHVYSVDPAGGVLEATTPSPARDDGRNGTIEGRTTTG